MRKDGGERREEDTEKRDVEGVKEGNVRKDSRRAGRQKNDAG